MVPWCTCVGSLFCCAPCRVAPRTQVCMSLGGSPSTRPFWQGARISPGFRHTPREEGRKYVASCATVVNQSLIVETLLRLRAPRAPASTPQPLRLRPFSQNEMGHPHHHRPQATVGVDYPSLATNALWPTANQWTWHQFDDSKLFRATNGDVEAARAATLKAALRKESRKLKRVLFRAILEVSLSFGDVHVGAGHGLGTWHGRQGQCR